MTAEQIGAIIFGVMLWLIVRGIKSADRVMTQMERDNKRSKRARSAHSIL